MSDHAADTFGPPITGVPVLPPTGIPLIGTLVELRPLNPERDAAELFAASHDAADPHLWDYLPAGPFTDEQRFARWLREMARPDDPLFLTIVDRSTGSAAGMASYMRIVPEHAVMEIGFIWFGPKLQRTRGATEAIYLLARHTFDDLYYRRLEWKCNALNARSRRAALRFGFIYEGIFRNHMVVKGRSRDTAWYSMLDSAWPHCKQAFETWLQPENFEHDGTQRRTLEDIRAGASPD